jgi:hypothetical protein
MKMNKKIILGLVAGLTLSLTAIVGCGGSSNNNNNGGGGGSAGGGGTAGGGGGGGGGGGAGGGGTSSPDMGFQCVTNPVSSSDFLNSCPEATVSNVDIEPFYPTLAPNGVLPSLP